MRYDTTTGRNITDPTTFETVVAVLRDHRHAITLGLLFVAFVFALFRMFRAEMARRKPTWLHDLGEMARHSKEFGDWGRKQKAKRSAR